MPAKEMKKVIEMIVTRQGKIEAFLRGKGFYLRIENPPYMALSIERRGREISVTHYFTQDGDLVPDPDMSFEIGQDGEWYPAAIQFSTGLYRRAIQYSADGRRLVNQVEMKDQIAFSRIWARNLRWQGFDQCSATALVLV